MRGAGSRQPAAPAPPPDRLLHSRSTRYYADLAGPENAKKYQDFVYLAGSASAEFFADMALCPFEAVKVRQPACTCPPPPLTPPQVKVQTNPTWAVGLSDGLPKFVAEEGYGGLYRGLPSLWGRQIPYTMMKFGAFERTVMALYANVVPKPKEECSKVEQLGVSFAAGYIAGVLCAVVSHPADNLVSKLNSNKAATVGSIISEMGWGALLTRGLPLRIFMVGTLTGLQWGIYDAFKVRSSSFFFSGVSLSPTHSSRLRFSLACPPREPRNERGSLTPPPPWLHIASSDAEATNQKISYLKTEHKPPLSRPWGPC